MTKEVFLSELGDFEENFFEDNALRTGSSVSNEFTVFTLYDR